MKKPILPVSIVAVILLLFILIYGAAVVPWEVEPTERNTFSPEQQSEICEKLKFELASGETLSTIYWPGFLQSAMSLTVTIHGVRSREDFLRRVYFETPSNRKSLGEEGTLYFDDYLLLREGGYTEDYLCSLSFVEQDGFLSAYIYVSGYIEQLSGIYNFLYEPWQPYFSNTFLKFLLITELVLILFLIAQIPIYLIRLRKKSEFHDYQQKPVDCGSCRLQSVVNRKDPYALVFSLGCKKIRNLSINFGRFRETKAAKTKAEHPRQPPPPRNVIPLI